MQVMPLAPYRAQAPLAAGGPNSLDVGSTNQIGGKLAEAKAAMGGDPPEQAPREEALPAEPTRENSWMADTVPPPTTKQLEAHEPDKVAATGKSVESSDATGLQGGRGDGSAAELQPVPSPVTEEKDSVLDGAWVGNSDQLQQEPVAERMKGRHSRRGSTSNRLRPRPPARPPPPPSPSHIDMARITSPPPTPGKLRGASSTAESDFPWTDVAGAPPATPERAQQVIPETPPRRFVRHRHLARAHGVPLPLLIRRKNSPKPAPSPSNHNQFALFRKPLDVDGGVTLEEGESSNTTCTETETEDQTHSASVDDSLRIEDVEVEGS